MTTKKGTDKYQKLTPIEHVLKRGAMYLSSLEIDLVETWIYNEDTENVEKKEIKYCPALYKIFDEIVSNTIDHAIRLQKEQNDNPDADIKQTKMIEVNIDKETGYIEVINNGQGIDIYKDEKHDMYIPEMLLGSLHSSTNYNDDEQRLSTGMNGLGASLVNIYSTEFHLETVDNKRKLKYSQVFSENMSIKTQPTISKYSKYPFTSIKFLPDYKRFKCEKLSDDMYQIFCRRVLDICCLTNENIKVFLNKKQLTIKSFEKYCELFLSKSKTQQVRYYEKINDNFEYMIAENDVNKDDDSQSVSSKDIKTINNSFQHITFINGINCMQGGKATDYTVNQFIRKFIDYAKGKKRKGIENIKSQYIKDNIFIFIKAIVPDAEFTSQSKENLSTPYSKFGFQINISDKAIEKLYKSHILDKLLSLNSDDNDKKLQKTDGKKVNRIYGIPQLDDANFAGGPKSIQCSLILTEGLSAKSLAIAGLSVIGRDYYGIYPLKGKVLNVDNASVDKIANNTEINDIKKIMGLQAGKDYTTKEDLATLRYGKIVLLMDMDVDGHHIKGLIFNMFYKLWPSLLEHHDFAFTILTPIVKVKKGKQSISFYNQNDYNKWCLDNNNGNGWDIKYYKGLGTSTSQEAKEYFKDMNRVDYKLADKKECFGAIDLAFNSDRKDDRKEWIKTYNRDAIIKYNKGQTIVSYDTFINKELIHFSVYNVERSIPNICDGLKISTRKILYSCFKKNLVKDIKVAQLAGYVSENSAYHHGEVSLQEAIIGMAQDYVGSNNINLLEPNGQFGTRQSNGNDAASSRYIYTQLMPITQKLFNKQDLNILEYKNDDGLQVEPYYYLPIIPMVLINGAIGIGTGYSTFIPCFNPKDIVQAIKYLLEDNYKEFNKIEFVPYYRGFKGTIEKEEKNSKISYKTYGIFKKIFANKILITELPIGISIDQYKEFLDDLIVKKSKILKNYVNNSTEKDVKFELEFYPNILNDEYIDKIYKEFKLVNDKLKFSNMNLLNENGTISSFDNIHDIIRHFYNIRYDGYIKRKEYILNDLKEKIKYMNAKAQFIMDIIDKKLIVANNKKDNIIAYLEKHKYPKKDDNYNYLIMMPIIQQTIEKKDELLNAVNDLKMEIKNLEDKTPNDLWNDDINDFIAYYDKNY